MDEGIVTHEGEDNRPVLNCIFQKDENGKAVSILRYVSAGFAYRNGEPVIYPQFRALLANGQIRFEASLN